MSLFKFKKNIKTDIGNPFILGATVDSKGCNFALFSKNASSIKLLLFEEENSNKPRYIIDFNIKLNKTGDIWHIYVYDIGPGFYYGFIIDGPYDPAKSGHRFNQNKLLLDPYGKAVGGKCYWHLSNAYGYDLNSNLGDLSFSKEKNYETVVKSIIVDNSKFDWENDKPLNILLKDSIIYEMHVRGFTIHESSKVKNPGTYLAITEKISYLKELGITAIELLPVFEFNELEDLRFNPVTKERLKNFWGYSTISFFSPESWYSTTFNSLVAINEFKTMVKELHKAGIEIILDVVFNHTGEGNEFGPTISFKGIDNKVYYMLEKHPRRYKNYSGCGNTLNCNHPIVKRFIKECLIYWVLEMHIDGFRFDLATILGRDQKGEWMPNYSVLSEISNDPILSKTKIIAECWDASGLYKVGGFPSGWSEWNGRFRDDVRMFINGDKNKVQDFALRIFGSPDLFLEEEEKKPYHSINFITCHDGFTLNDLVSYNSKHNEINCENNKDGSDFNFSFNYGIEGPTDIKEINEIRDRQMKNFFLILMISHGTPMILSGDEVKFSKHGNNNTYCQDNFYNWHDWNLLKKHKDFFEFCKFMINFRKKHPVLRRETFYSDNNIIKNISTEVNWHGVDVNNPDWSSESHSIAFVLKGSFKDGETEIIDNNFYIAVNSYWRGLVFNLPEPLSDKKWYYNINTAENPSFYKEDEEKKIDSKVILVKSRSIVILIEK